MRFLTTFSSFLFLVVLSSPLVLFAEKQGGKDGSLDELFEMDLEQLANIKVSVASKRNELIKEAPGIINTITAKEIEESGVLNIFEVLQRIPAMFGQYNVSSPSVGQSLAIRGDWSNPSNSHVLILINGRPIRDGFREGSDNTVLSSFPVNAVQKIEVIRGPGSVLYGSGAYSGVVNIITKKAQRGDLHGGAKATYGSFNTGLAEGFIAYGAEEFDVRASLRYGSSDETKVKGNDFTGTYGEDEPEFEETSLNINANYGNLSLDIFQTKKRLDVFPFPYIYPFQQSSQRQRFINTGYELELSEDWTMQLDGTFAHYDEQYPRGVGIQSDDWLGEIAVEGALSPVTNILFGTNYQYTEGEDKALSYDYINRRTSAYAQFDHKPLRWLKLIAGMQFNKADHVDPNLSPRVGSIVHFNKHWGSKLLYAKAFRSAAPVEKFVDIPGVALGNPNLDPETIQTLDAQIFYQNDSIFGALTFFHSEEDDKFERDGIGFINGAGEESDGITLEGKVVLNKSWDLQASVSYQDNETDDQRESQITPNWIAKTGVKYSGIRGVSIDVFDQYFGTSNTIATNAQVNPTPDSYHLITAAAKIDLHTFFSLIPEGVSLTLYGFNLLDEDIYISQPESPVRVNTIQSRAPRSAYATIAARF